MAIVPLKYYLHDDYSGEEMSEWILSQTGVTLDDDLLETAMGRFYEVGFNCTLNTETGEIEILSIALDE